MIKFTKWDILDYLKTEDDVNRYLAVAFEEGDPDFITVALGDAAKARGLMSKAAKKAGVARESLYHSLSKKGSPGFKTVMSVVNSLGYKLTLVPAK
ncbi:helix turn helix XRE family-like proteins [Candidatus Termititenax dinenymphae]|uniref:Helix turn helix XRE family-like proteins n=1 Tax=Candidatus Termititenax dinenymphae TaxID=2218523 RepID=A0A388TKN3_9BACT|nr:helix turn helix XRE family-like proteins [Candidatus Termititenax dinenymphae]